MAWTWLALVAWLPAPAMAQDYLALKARWYDHDYDDFGAFSATRVTGCTHNVNGLTRGMVQDTLIFDAALGKKYPRRGAVDDCSADLEKWFDPAQSRLAACGNLFFRNVGDTARPVWRFDEPEFFPVDSISRQRRITLPDGSLVANDYAYCMEINAALTYKGGETLKIRGDDDTWVFLDNRLAVDQGGIHFAQDGTVALDTLPFLKGKLGRTMDLDVYYCSRQPGTAVFGMEAAAQLKPLSVKSLQITDSAGNALTSKDILVGKTRLCARASYQSPGEEICGNYKTPPDLSFLAADWDLNGKTLSMMGGQACLELDPADFPNNTRINLTAKADGQISRISLTLIRLARPRTGLILGDGRAESVEVGLDSAGGPASDGLQIGFDFAGVRRSAWIMPDAARPWTLSGRLEEENIGPFGITGFLPLPADTRQTIFTRVSDRQLSLGDGVSPVLTGAWFRWGLMNGNPAYLDIQVSESLAGSGDSLAGSLAWKRSGSGLPDPADSGAVGVKVSENRYFLSLPESVARGLRSGDSVSLSGSASDSRGNHARPHYIPLLFPRNPDETVGDLRLRTNPVRGPAFIPAGGRGALIPVDGFNRPLGSDAAEAHLAEAGGPVLEIPTLVPLARIQLGFHDHLGTFVNAAERDFSASDWDAMRAASPGDTTWVRLMWYPVSRSGGRLGTGAYVVQGRLWTREGLANGPDGEKVQVKAATYLVRPRLFGYLRD
jgi:fibro-slime domain-containing protein